VLEGSLEYHVDGSDPKTYNAGEALMLPAETVHAVRNAGNGVAAELATYVVEKAYQTVLDGSAGIKQVLLPIGGGVQGGSR
jgi:quercetin dioxygenase-like cupin family protein